ATYGAWHRGCAQIPSSGDVTTGARGRAPPGSASRRGPGTPAPTAGTLHSLGTKPLGQTPCGQPGSGVARDHGARCCARSVRGQQRPLPTRPRAGRGSNRPRGVVPSRSGAAPAAGAVPLTPAPSASYPPRNKTVADLPAL